MSWFGRRHKYGAKRVTQTLGGVEYKYPSMLEASVHLYLYRLELDGMLFSLKHQPKPYVFLTLAEIEIRPDFSAYYRNGEPIYFEAKGAQTKEWRLKSRLWAFYGPCRLRVFSGSHQRLQELPEIVPQGYNFQST